MPESGEGNPVSWEDARVGFKPAELVRGERSLTVEYRCQDNHWTATSPDLDGFEVSASSLGQLKTAAHAVLDDWLDPAVRVREELVGQPEQPRAGTAGRSVKHRGYYWAPVKAAASVLRGKRHRKSWRSVSEKGLCADLGSQGIR
jgi:hypothetical protein